MHSGREFVLGMLKAGVSGYILKESLSDELARAIRLVADGKNYLDPELTGIAMDRYAKGRSRLDSGVATAAT